MGAKKRTSAPARCQPRTVSSSLFFTPSWVTPRTDLSALGRMPDQHDFVANHRSRFAFGQYVEKVWRKPEVTKDLICPPTNLRPGERNPRARSCRMLTHNLPGVSGGSRSARVWAAITGVIFFIVIIVAMTLVAPNCRHIDFVENNPKKPFIKLWRVRKSVSDNVDLRRTPLDNANERIDKSCRHTRVND